MYRYNKDQTSYEYDYPSTDHRIFKSVSFKTGSTAATTQNAFRFYENGAWVSK